MTHPRPEAFSRPRTKKSARPKKPPSGKLCAQCSKPLIGRQARFCSDPCRNDHWNNARKRGEMLEIPSDDPAIQAFLSDLLQLIHKHKEVIETANRKNDE